MNQVISNKTEALEELFYTFAEFYKYPTKEFYEEVSTGELDEFFKETMHTLNIPIKTNFQNNVPCLETLQKSYMNCFSGFTTPFAPPIESVYKVWTNDKTAKVSIAGSKGYLMGDSALHMRHLLKQYNIEVPEGYENMPDHLTILLEFCAFLQKHTNSQQLVQFMNDHLDWIESFEEELTKLNDHSFYVYVTNILNQVVCSLKDKDC